MKIFSHVKRWSLRRIFANGLEMAARYLKEMDVVRPQAIADGLYEQITTNKEFEKRDDITIMVLGIWDRY
mgnify:CR=1 FL=1